MSDERRNVLCDILKTRYGRDRHCGWLALEVQRRIFGRDIELTDLMLPETPEQRRAAIVAAQVREGWRGTTKPTDGDIALIRYNDAPGAEEHVGVYLAPERGIIHTSPRRGVLIDTIAELTRLHGARITYLTPT